MGKKKQALETYKWVGDQCRLRLPDGRTVSTDALTQADLEALYKRGNKVEKQEAEDTSL